MTPILFVYDDTHKPNEQICGIVGDKRFGDVVLGRATIREEMRAFAAAVFENAELVTLTDAASLARHKARFDTDGALERRRVVHFDSQFFFADRKKAGAVLQNCAFAERHYVARQDGAVVFHVFADEAGYAAFLSQASEGTEGAGEIRLAGDEFLHIGSMDGFVSCITQRYDTRYFNTLASDAYTVRKSSSHKEKLRAEYDFWHLLPDDMKMWFVMPFDYQEDETGASYAMERVHVPNLAVKYVHNAISEAEFSEILTRYFRFVDTRASRRITKEAYAAKARALYVDKTAARIAGLKRAPNYEALARYLTAGTQEGGIDALYERFNALYERSFAAARPVPREVIGHGDAGFNNILFDRATRMLKLVDPKGARTEAELWTDPYYDVCKLSHSVCGLYDFFNSGMYELTVGPDMRLCLTVLFDSGPYRRIFRRFVEENGFDYRLTRVGEAALFLSMLPLHIDNPRKVLGFALNAKRIMEEIEQDG